MEEKITLMLDFSGLNSKYYDHLKIIMNEHEMTWISYTVYEGELQRVVDSLHTLVNEDWFFNHSSRVKINIDNTNYEVVDKLDIFRRWIVLIGNNEDRKKDFKNMIK